MAEERDPFYISGYEQVPLYLTKLIDKELLKKFYNKYLNPVDIAHGGTNATTAEQARENLGVPSEDEIRELIAQVAITILTQTADSSALNLKFKNASGTNIIDQNLNNATTSTYGVTKLNSSTSDTSTTTAATPSAVKSSYDLANTANTTANTANTTANTAKSIADSKCSKVLANNISITSSSWTLLEEDDGSGNYNAGYPYRAAVTVTGMTTDHCPEVIFSTSDAISGYLAPTSQSYTGGVYIYSTTALDMTVKTVMGIL